MVLVFGRAELSVKRQLERKLQEAKAKPGGWRGVKQTPNGGRGVKPRQDKGGEDGGKTKGNLFSLFSPFPRLAGSQGMRK